MNKKKGELGMEALKKQMEEQTKAYLKEYQEINEPLSKKYQRRMVPIINWTEKGAFPLFAVDLYTPNETLDTKSKADKGTNSDNKASQG